MTVQGVVALVAVVIGAAQDVGLAAVSAFAAGAAIAVFFGCEVVSFDLLRMFSVVGFVLVSLQTDHNLCNLYLCQWFIFVQYCVW